MYTLFIFLVQSDIKILNGYALALRDKYIWQIADAFITSIWEFAISVVADTYDLIINLVLYFDLNITVLSYCMQLKKITYSKVWMPLWYLLPVFQTCISFLVQKSQKVLIMILNVIWPTMSYLSTRIQNDIEPSNLLLPLFQLEIEFVL